MLRKINWDILGIGASILCAIHCALLPLLLVSLPILGVNIIHNPTFEFGMIGVAFVVGTLALQHGFRRHHRHPGPWVLFAAGLILLVAKQVWHFWELALLPFAVLFIIGAHVLNYRLSKEVVHVGEAGDGHGVSGDGHGASGAGNGANGAGHGANGAGHGANGGGSAERGVSEGEERERA